MHKDWWQEERAALTRGFRVIAGIDEAGRGPLAGPVVAACVLLPFGEEIRGVADSKTLSPAQRDRAFDRIHEQAEAIGIGMVDPPTIDRLNILRATHHAMRCALDALSLRPDHVLIDGLPVHPFPVLQTALVKGDARSASIAAASIVAKVTRDRLMVQYDSEWPQYGFALHKGYPTPEHLARLEEHGPCPIHRRSFAPVARLLEEGRPTTDDRRPTTGTQSSVLSPQSSLSFEDDRHRVGERGETVAAAHLRRLGWQILATRFRCREGELDIVAQDGATVVFVEVKTRRGRSQAPIEAVTGRKRSRIVTAAEAWLAANGGTERPCRFDVVEVLIALDGYATVHLIQGAFMAGE